MTNRQYSHQWYQQHANIVQHYVNFDVCRSLAVCAHSFHSRTKREKVEHIEAQKLIIKILTKYSGKELKMTKKVHQISGKTVEKW